MTKENKEQFPFNELNESSNPLKSLKRITNDIFSALSTKEAGLFSMEKSIKEFQKKGLTNRDICIASDLGKGAIEIDKDIEDVWALENSSEIFSLAEIFKTFYKDGGSMNVKKKYPFDSDDYKNTEDFLKEIYENFSLKVDEKIQIQNFLENDVCGNLQIGFVLSTGNTLLYPFKINQDILSLNTNQRLKKLHSFLIDVRQKAQVKGIKEPSFEIQFQREGQFPEEDDNMAY